MTDIVKIVIDTKGSDKGPENMIKGAAEALLTHPRMGAVLVGDSLLISEEIKKWDIDPERVEIADAPDEITNYDNPAEGIFTKPRSSMVTALKALGSRDDLFGMITPGNTGALITGSIRFLSGQNRVRPALGAILPSSDGGFTCLVDTGSTVDCTAPMLLHFARLGSDLMSRAYGLESPRIGLLSNGAEPTKGNALVKETHVLLREADDLNFVGNVEGNVALSGVCDVLVCDGFAGNQVLKVTEGTAARIITDVVKYAKRTQNSDVMTLVGHLMGVYDISSLGGGILMGCSKPVIKTRGSADSKAVVSTAGMLINMASNKAVFDRTKNRI